MGAISREPRYEGKDSRSGSQGVWDGAGVGAHLSSFHHRMGTQHLVCGVTSWRGAARQVAGEGVNGHLRLGGCRLSRYLAWMCGDGRGTLGPTVGRKEWGLALWPQKL